MVRKWTKVGYERPILSEEVNPERSTIVLPLRKTKAAEDGRTEKAQLQGHRQVHLTKNQQMALDLAQSQGRVTTAILAQEAGISKQTASRTIDHPEDFYGHSLSVSDVVVLHKDGNYSDRKSVV